MLIFLLIFNIAMAQNEDVSYIDLETGKVSAVVEENLDPLENFQEEETLWDDDGDLYSQVPEDYLVKSENHFQLVFPTVKKNIVYSGPKGQPIQLPVSPPEGMTPFQEISRKQSIRRDEDVSYPKEQELKPVTLNSRITLQGRVLIPEGHDAQWIHLRIAGTSYEVKADEEGYFTFKGLPLNSQFEILVWDEENRLNRRLIPVDTTNNEFINISLQPVEVFNALGHIYGEEQMHSLGGLCGRVQASEDTSIEGAQVYLKTASGTVLRAYYFSDRHFPDPMLDMTSTDPRFCIFNIPEEIGDILIQLKDGLEQSFPIHTKPSVFEHALNFYLDGKEEIKKSEPKASQGISFKGEADEDLIISLRDTWSSTIIAHTKVTVSEVNQSLEKTQNFHWKKELPHGQYVLVVKNQKNEVRWIQTVRIEPGYENEIFKSFVDQSFESSFTDETSGTGS